MGVQKSRWHRHVPLAMANVVMISGANWCGRRSSGSGFCAITSILVAYQKPETACRRTGYLGQQHFSTCGSVRLSVFLELFQSPF